MRRRAHALRTWPALALAAALALTVAGCGGDEDSGTSPHQAMVRAEHAFDRASSVRLTLSTDDQPDGDGILGAKGTLTDAPAFKGDVRVSISGFAATVPVVSLDGTVHAKLPLSTGWQVIDPEQYGAPDPADFKDPHSGLGSLLPRLKGLKQKGQERDGKLVLTTYRGTLAGRWVKQLLPGARAGDTYPCTLGIDDDGRLRTLSVTGAFFGGSGDVTYDIGFDDYGRSVTIAAP